jgi:Transmembrane protein 131-like N-terminal/Abnormal spindle-like microcephaly-assoc'd, ASPM-SPD-2-Hydin
MTRSRSRRFFTVAIISVAVLLSLVPPKVHADGGALTNWPANLRFGQVSIGQTETQLVSLTNNGQNSVSISAIGVNNAEFSVPPMALPIVLAPGQSIDVSVVFAPTSTGWAGGKISFATTQSSYPLNLPVMGTGVNAQAATASPANISFGAVGVGSTARTPVVLTNNQPWKLTLSSLQTLGGAFSVSGPSFPMILGSGQSVTLTVTFTPQSVGMTFGSAFVMGPGVNINFTGTGTNTAAGQLTVAPGSLNFGNVTVGTTGVAPATLIASGGNVTISSATSSSSQFALQGASFPLTIPAGQSISVNVGFTPQTSGTASGTLSFSSNAPNSPATGSLAGTGVMPSVDLSWSPAQDAVGYNVYRCVAASCSYTKVNSSLDPDVSLTDNGVTPGQTYSYVATSVSSSGQESSYSSAVEIAVP